MTLNVHSELGVLIDFNWQVFTLVFTVECILKLLALSKEFFQCGWNIFDLCIVTASICDLIFELVDGLSVLRGLRLVSPSNTLYHSSRNLLSCFNCS